MIDVTWASGLPRWLDASGARADLVLSSRVRLARNVAGHRFPTRAEPAEKETVYSEVVSAAQAGTALEGRPAWDFVTLDEWERRLLVERQLASKRLAEGGGHRGLVVHEDEDLSITINEEDHVRIQTMASGLDLEAPLARARALDDQLGGSLGFAGDEEFGFYTSCPTNVGTGLRASVLVHLAGLVLCGEVKRVHQAVGEMGMAVRGWFGEGSRALGDFYQISNQRTLGLAEDDAVEQLQRVVDRVLQLELEARERALEDVDRRRRIEDRVHRSLAILRSARLLSVDQVMACASDVRLGMWLGRFDDDVDEATLNRLAVDVQPAHLGRPQRAVPGGLEADWVRARVVRRALTGA